MNQSQSFKINGIYSSITWLKLRELGIKQFCFDFRPRSMNFLQHHRFFSSLESNFRSDEIYYLHFADEKDFVVKKFLEDLKSHHELGSHLKNFILFFSDQKNIDFYEQFSWPYVLQSDAWCRHSLTDLSTIIRKANYLKGISLGLKNFVEWNERNQFYIRIKELKDLLKKNDDEFLSFELELNWDDQLSHTLIEFLPITIVSFSINSLVEQSYREVDHNLLIHQLNWFDQQLTSIFNS